MTPSSMSTASLETRVSFLLRSPHTSTIPQQLAPSLPSPCSPAQPLLVLTTRAVPASTTVHSRTSSATSPRARALHLCPAPASLKPRPLLLARTVGLCRAQFSLLYLPLAAKKSEEKNRRKERHGLSWNRGK
ncbi:hypothetical protein M0R45_019250 [Rubus argutus]|uniref:Uncharacterized protein n=1 Tax=Rubus argutus TaxID=59490 RepID=A0AAW1X683_RUBAR